LGSYSIETLPSKEYPPPPTTTLAEPWKPMSVLSKAAVSTAEREILILKEISNSVLRMRTPQIFLENLT